MPLTNQSRSEEGMQRRCKQLIEEKQRSLEIRKKFLSRIDEIENCLDAAPGDEEGNGGDNAKRRKKSAAYDISEIAVLSPEEVREDLNAISGVNEVDVYIEDDGLFIQSEKFVKGDKVKVKLHGEEFYGSIGSIRDDGIIVKTKDYKRLVVSLDDMASCRTAVKRIGCKEYR
jgi:hypothetical protein